MKIKEGYFFGELDLLFYNEIRKYTFMATKDSELLVLSKKHFKNLFFLEFRDIGMNFINNAYMRKKKMRQVWKEAIIFCKSHLSFTKKSEEDFEKEKNKYEMSVFEGKKFVSKALEFKEDDEVFFDSLSF